jgi:hypothetical protein
MPLRAGISLQIKELLFQEFIVGFHPLNLSSTGILVMMRHWRSLAAKRPI